MKMQNKAMKTKTITLVCMLILFCCSNLISKEAGTESKSPASGTITVYTTPDLYTLAMRWAGEFTIANPNQAIKVFKVEKSEIPSFLTSGDNLCLVPDESSISGSTTPVFQVVVGREIMVPVISSKNPYLQDINKKGISRESLAKSLSGTGKMNWGTLLGNSLTAPVKYYMLNDEFTKSVITGFLKTDESSVSRITIKSKEDLFSALQNDPSAIGFCRMTDILKPNSSGFTENLLLMPIDKNGNGKRDNMEKIYSNFQDFSRGVWIGKYPKSLTSNLFCLAKTQPANEAEIAFLNWVLTSGQDFLPATGYSDLVSNERQSQMDKLIKTSVVSTPPQETNSLAKIVLLVLVVIVAGSFTLDLIIRRYRKNSSGHTTHSEEQHGVFEEKNVNLPKGLYYDKTHTWAFMEQDGSVKIGIDDFLQHVTGPITSIAMKKPGDRIKKGDRLCIIIQKGKHLNIYAPVSGTIKSYNHLLSGNSSMINTAPYSDGWVYVVEPSNWVREIEFLSMADKYKTWLTAEFARLKDFLAASMQVHTPMHAGLILQDGGALKDNVLADLGPEVWEDFQTKFINTSR